MSNSIYKELTETINKAYEQGVTMQEAERLAARTLTIRIELTDQIKERDLDARMKKHGVKAIKARAFVEEIVKHEKKPTESQLDAAVNLSPLVEAAELLFAESETTKNQLEAYSDIFKDAHIFFRGVAKGQYE